MKVLCGFIDPVYLFHPQSISLLSYNDFSNYISGITKLGEVIFKTSVEGYNIGLTNDGCFYVEYDWSETSSIHHEKIVLIINKYIIFPLQLFVQSNSLTQIKPEEVFRGEIINNIPQKTIHDNRTPTGKINIDRFSIRDEWSPLLASHSNDHELKMRVSIFFPHLNHLNINLFEAKVDEIKRTLIALPNLKIELLSIFLSLASNAQTREAYYFGIIFLESICLEIITHHGIKKHKKKKINKLLLSEKFELINIHKLIISQDYVSNFSIINNKRNHVFHQGFIPILEDIFLLHKVTKAILEEKFNLVVPNIGIRLIHV